MAKAKPESYPDVAHAGQKILAKWAEDYMARTQEQKC
jgi:hypothetical protein